MSAGYDWDAQSNFRKGSNGAYPDLARRRNIQAIASTSNVSDSQDSQSPPPQGGKAPGLLLKTKRSFSSLNPVRLATLHRRRGPSEPLILISLTMDPDSAIASTSRSTTQPTFDHSVFASSSEQLQLRNTKSESLLQSLRKKVSLRNMRSSLGRRESVDPSEHPSLRAPPPDPIAHPPSPHHRKRKGRHVDVVPPVPALPPDDPEAEMQIDTNFDEMDDILDRALLYNGGSDASSPTSDIWSSSHSQSQSQSQSQPQSQPHSGSSHVGSPQFTNPFGSGPVQRLYPPVPESWATDCKDQKEPGRGSPQVEEGSDGSDGSDDIDIATTVGPRWRIRIYWEDNTDNIVPMSTSDTVAMLAPQLDLRLPAGEEREGHQLYLKERGGERILAPTERPAHILRRRLEQAGYDATDSYNLLGGAGTAGVPFLLKFMYKSQFLGSAEEELYFSDFEYINLTGRSLRTIPVILHRHADLIISLRLSRNPMIDLPLDFIQSCTALRKLYLSHMSMRKVPHSICHSTALTFLDLSSNCIVTLDDAHLEDIPGLTILHVQNNRLHSDVPRLRSLTELNISNNRFRTFPPGLSSLHNLTDLDISFNAIAELPDELGRLTKLERLVIVGNQVSKIPDECSSLAQLREFDCRRNQIADLSVVYMLPVLETLSADHNALYDLGLSLGPSLTTLDVSHNEITQLSVVLGPLGKGPFALTALDISHAKLSILDNDTLAQLTSLRTLKLDHNSLRALPDSLGALRWLETLSCADNALGELPESVGRLQKLDSLDLHNNNITRLPLALWNCASLSRLNVTSNLLVMWHDPPPCSYASCDEISSISASFADTPPSRAFVKRKPSTSIAANIPPLAHSLEMLYLGENSLTDDAIQPLTILKELRVLNLSFNDLQDLPFDFFKNLKHLEEVYLSGNRLTSIPSEDLPRLTRLSTLFLNGNKLQTLPQELGKVKSLTVLDVGSNLLKYNINNSDFDWNWNFNKSLMYLNLSGNKRLQIKSDVSTHGQRQSMSLITEWSLAGFSGLTQLRVLGLMDVTITTTGTNMGVDIPDENDNRRVRSSSSLVNGMSYGIADTLGKNNYLNMLDLVHEFRGIKKEAVFAMFGRAQPPKQSPAATSNRIAKYLKDNFIRVFISQLSALDLYRHEGVSDALRRSFLKLNQDLHDVLFAAARQRSMSRPNGLGGSYNSAFTDHSIVHNGASGIVVYIVDKRMYVANTGNALAVVSRGGSAHPVSRKHEPYDRSETARIRAAEGWISPPGLVNDELDISRSFGFYHLLPVVNARPDVFVYDLSALDEFVIVANRGLWDYVSYQTAVDMIQRVEPMVAAQKLRDFALSYGAEGSTMIMVIGVADLFRGSPAATAPVDRPRRRGIGITDRTLDRLKEEVPPPIGHVAIVFTDIKGSTHLWEANPAGMITAMNLHNNLLRRHLRMCGGYEVRTEGDSFMCSFPTALAAVWWCMTIQVELLSVPWPLEILECADGKAVYDDLGHLIARGLSVRMGIHCGAPLCQIDPVTNRMDYFGLIVTRSSRIASRADGGHIMCSSDVISEVYERVLDTEPVTEHSDAQPQEVIDAIRRLDPVVVPVGEVRLKGLEVPEILSLVFPATLVRRNATDEATVDKSISSSSMTSLQISQIHELALVCLRLEMCTSQRVFRPSHTAGDGPETSIDAPNLLRGDPSVLLPPDINISDEDLLMILNSLLARIENVEIALRTRSIPSLDQKDALISALRALDERTLNEVWSTFRGVQLQNSQ